MNRPNQFFSVTLATAMLCLASGLATPAQAQTVPAEGTVDLLTTPPELTAKVAPNVVLTYDDSGSMTWRHMPDQRPYSGVSWGAGSGQTEDDNSKYPSGSGPYLCAGVIDPRVTPDPTNPKSWSMNGVYYNPNATYKPPLKADGSSFPDASFSAAWRNGIKHNRPNNPQTSVTHDLTNTSTSSGKRFCGNMPGYYQLKSSVTLAVGGDGKLDAASLNSLYTSSNWEWISLPTDQRQNFANWYSYYHTRQMAAISATTHAFATFDRSVRIGWQNINSNTTDNPFVTAGTTRLAPFDSVLRDDFYDWMLSNPASGSTPNQTATSRVGKLFSYGEGKTDTTNPYWDPDTGRELSCRKNFHILMTDGMWNGSTVGVTQTDTKATTLPDGRSYSASEAAASIFWNEGSAAQKTMADLAFHYWATDLRPDFQNNPQMKLKVRPYFNSSEGATDRNGNIVSIGANETWLDKPDLYWNPANNPATWAHVVQYMIGFGVDGTIPATPSNYQKLRKGEIAWPKLDGSGVYTDNAKKIDDMWHAAINSRGEFFATSSPDELTAAMQKIVASVVAQTSSSTPASVSLPILTGGNSAYEGGYDSTGWPGTLRRRKLKPNGTFEAAMWDAGCLLTGGQCNEPVGTNTAPGPNARYIVTSDGAGTGAAFKWSSLTTAQKYVLNQKTNPTGPCSSTATGSNCDGYGNVRVDYLRGDRSLEAGGSTPQLRPRKSLLGAIINAEPEYVSSPIGGYNDMLPTGSPEQVAAEANENNSYAGYQNAKRARKPMVYVASNDGMLHAFDAGSGKEHWAYVPDLLIRNGRLRAMTEKDADLVPGIDSAPRQRDVFIHGKWRTILIGSMRLGGRGVYALDVTTPIFNSEAEVARNAASGGVVMWEFSSGDTPSTADDAPCAEGSRTCASLGYTYDSANVARIRYNNKWVAVVSSGYFPDSKDVAAKPSDITEAAASRTSLLVIDLETGKLIREIPTSKAPQTVPSGFKTFGLSTPMIYDVGSDELDDLVYAGDLAGNLWRFDISDTDPDNWSVDLMFSNYGDGGAANPGDQPFVFNPSALRDPTTNKPILVIGSGKYLGADDRTINIPEQAWYGIRDYGKNSSFYPIRVNQLVTQKLAQNAEIREITGFDNPASAVPSAPPMVLRDKDINGLPVIKEVRAHGWRMRLNISTERGERAQRRASPIPSANVALLYGLIPKSDDPCDPGARYSIMGFDGATGAPVQTGGGLSDGTGVVGATTKLETPPGDPLTLRGGGATIPNIADLPDDVKEALLKAISAAIPPWHRGAWRELTED